MTRDLRKFTRQTHVRLIVGAFVLLFLVGDGLIYVIYGPGAAWMGLLCMLGGLVPIGLTLLALSLLEWITKRANPE